MKYILGVLIVMNTMNNRTIFDFKTNSDLKNWEIVNDNVMGGLSSSKIEINSKGNGVFSGAISLANNGGFSSVHYYFNKIEVQSDSKIAITIKGDGKDYQLRVKNEASNYYSYIAPFSTSGEWEVIIISLKDMYPQFRGNKLEQANFSHSHIEKLAFLIANKRPEDFKLLIDKIELL